MIYIPTSLDQPVGAAFGVQAGFAELSSSIIQGGFAKVRKAAAASPTFASPRQRPQSIVTTIQKRGLPAIIFV
jgi:hypothetical protein